jgi:ribonucleoside-diphosphate reductase beta chain
MQIMNEIFNKEKTIQQYTEKQPLFFGPEPGLFDTVNKQYPSIWGIYKEMKSLDWDESEFDYSQCNADFKNCDKSVADMMIRTLAWQWEADSVASRSIAPVLAPFITDSSLWAAWQRISDNEVVHAATYSEIVRMSFDDPKQVLLSVLEVKESLERLDETAEVFKKLYQTSHKYALGMINKDDAYDDVFMGVIALLCLERIQFLASFAITFTICSSGLFQSIGKAVQKIAQDELEVHVKLDKEVLRILLSTDEGKASYQRNKLIIKRLLDSVVERELKWAEYIFSEGRSLLGTTKEAVSNWVLFNARDVYKFLDIESQHKFPSKNPMMHLEDWINISNVQAAPQEQDNNQYKVNVVIRDDNSATFEMDF